MAGNIPPPPIVSDDCAISFGYLLVLDSSDFANIIMEGDVLELGVARVDFSGQSIKILNAYFREIPVGKIVHMRSEAIVNCIDKKFRFVFSVQRKSEAGLIGIVKPGSR